MTNGIPAGRPPCSVCTQARDPHGIRVGLNDAMERNSSLTDESNTALREQAKRISPESMMPLSRAVYLANLAATLGVLVARNKESSQTAAMMLIEQGLAPRKPNNFSQWRSAHMSRGSAELRLLADRWLGYDIDSRHGVKC